MYSCIHIYIYIYICMYVCIYVCIHANSTSSPKHICHMKYETD